jgi:hypothetical protein
LHGDEGDKEKVKKHIEELKGKLDHSQTGQGI